jgi:hypothetical protein
MGREANEGTWCLLSIAIEIVVSISKNTLALHKVLAHTI